MAAARVRSTTEAMKRMGRRWRLIALVMALASALSPMHFRRRFTEIRIEDDAAALARAAAPLARVEGFEVHAQSMEARIRDNGA